MPTVANLSIYDAIPGDVAHDPTGAVPILVEAFRDGAVAQWVEPCPRVRGDYLRSYFTALIAHAAQYGRIRVACVGDRRTGVAVWYRYPLSGDVLDVHDIAATDSTVAASAADDRAAELENLLADRHPTAVAHWYLAYLGVAPHAQNQGVGTALVTDQPDRDRLPAYLEANDPRNRALYTRLGFLDHGRPVFGHHGPPVFPMWRPPAT